MSDIKVAAMGPANFLDYIEKDDLIITPGDRSDIILTTISAIASKNYPSPVGMLLSGALIPPPSVVQLLGGVDELAIPITVFPATPIERPWTRRQCRESYVRTTSVKLPGLLACLRPMWISLPWKRKFGSHLRHHVTADV